MDLSMKYKGDIYMKFKVPLPPLSESVVQFFTPLYHVFTKTL